MIKDHSNNYQVDKIKMHSKTIESIMKQNNYLRLGARSPQRSFIRSPNRFLLLKVGIYGINVTSYYNLKEKSHFIKQKICLHWLGKSMKSTEAARVMIDF